MTPRIAVVDYGMGNRRSVVKALEQEYAGKVKCVFIDPPYNTGSAFEHYDDGLG